MSMENMDRELKEQKRKTRNKRILSAAAVLVVVCGLAWWIMPKNAKMGSSGDFEQTAVEEKTKEVIDLLNQDDFEGLKAQSTEKMQKAIAGNAIVTVREEIGGDWGEFVSMGKIYSAEMRQREKHLAVTQTAVTYENLKVNYTISFDKELRIAGLYMKEIETE